MSLICFGHPDGASQELVSRNPSGIPTFQRRIANEAFKAGDLVGWSHGLGSAVNRAALTGSVMRF
jgi:hypothetical protein